MTDRAWKAIFDFYNIHDHDFNDAPFYITANEIKEATTQFTATRERESRILCKHDTRQSRPQLFIDKNLFILPVRNGHYAILRGEGYVDIPPIDTAPETYISQLDFEPDTVKVGDSEARHLDYAYAVGLIGAVMNDDSLVLTIRGRKFTPALRFRVGDNKIQTIGIQTEIDAIYEGKSQIVLVKMVKPFVSNIFIYPIYLMYRKYAERTSKPVNIILMERIANTYGIWFLKFSDKEQLNSVVFDRVTCWQVELRNQ